MKLSLIKGGIVEHRPPIKKRGRSPLDGPLVVLTGKLIASAVEKALEALGEAQTSEAHNLIMATIAGLEEGLRLHELAAQHLASKVSL
jgi:hypothetical protein